VEVYFDTSHASLTADALVGRRVRRFNSELGGFDKEGHVAAHSKADAFSDPQRLFLICWEDGSNQSWLPATAFAVPAVTDEMLARGADALFDSWRRQRDPEKVTEQRRTALKHARVVLEAAMER
jgi:hypothetical protein